MANFAVEAGDSQGEILSSLNYALANLGQATGISANVLVANTTTGQITNNTNNQLIGYLYQWINVRYANSGYGTVNFSTSPINQGWYGVLNTTDETPSNVNNPASYIWTRVTGGFGTTRVLWFATLGGRQVLFQPDNVPPSVNYNEVQDGVAINLDVITGATANQIINESIYFRANTAPLTPTGGKFNFTSLVLYPPTTPDVWSATVPVGDGQLVYLSQAIFSGNAGNASPSTVWSDPTVLASNFAGNTGPQGSRGPIPLGYVITDTDPTYWIDTQYSNAFSAPRANVIAPIGVSPYGQTYTPISGDTAQFFYPNLAYPGHQVTVVKSFSSNTSPLWQSVLANVVSGNVIYTGSITSSALNTNDIYAINISVVQ